MQHHLPLLDHVFVSIPTPDYDLAAGTAFLSDRYARTKVKTAQSSIGGSYSSVCIAGDNTLLELFDAGAPPLAGITSGLVFSFDTPGTMDQVRERLAGFDLGHEVVERTVDGVPVPWYQLLRPKVSSGPLALMFAEVTPAYYASIGATPEADGRLSRRGYLAAALAESRADDRLLAEFTAVELTVSAQTADRLTALLTELNFTASGSELEGPDAVIRLHIDDTATEGVTGLQTTLTGGWDGPPVRFGDRCQVDAAGWTFTPLAWEA